MTSSQKPVSIKRSQEPTASEASLPASPLWEPFASLRREIDRLFDEATSGWPFTRRLHDVKPWAPLASVPAADIVENDGEFVLSLDVPGMDEKDIEVKLSDGILTIRGEKSEETSEEKGDYRLSERRHGAFLRSFTLPESVDADRVTATYDKGVLRLVMPKTEEAKKKQRKIEVKAA